MSSRRRATDRRAAAAGFTVLELVISLSLLAVVTGAVTFFLESTLRSHRTSSATLEVERRGRMAFAKIKSVLRPAYFATIDPRMEGELFSSRIDFQRWDEDTGQLGPLERIQWRISPSEVDDGADDDGNGLIDDGEVVWVEAVGTANERTHVLLRSVPEFLFGETENGLDDNGNLMRDEPGFCVNFDGRTMTVRLTVSTETVDGDRVDSDFETRLHVRN